MVADDKYLDLDAALDEDAEAAEPLTVKLFGEEWELPGTPPAAVTLRVARWYTDGLMGDDGRPVEGGELTYAHYALLLADMVPKPVLDEWLDRGLDTDKLERATVHILGLYQAREKTNRAQRRAEGKGKAPRKGGKASKSTTSSNGGRSSRRTSTASTRSKTSSGS